MKLFVTFTAASIACLMATHAGMAAGKPKPTALISKWTDLNSQCRGGSGDDPKTQRACDRREEVGKQIDQAGWCYGREGQMGYQMQWHACGRGSSHPS